MVMETLSQYSCASSDHTAHVFLRLLILLGLLKPNLRTDTTCYPHSPPISIPSPSKSTCRAVSSAHLFKSQHNSFYLVGVYMDITSAPPPFYLSLPLSPYLPILRGIFLGDFPVCLRVKRLSSLKHVKRQRAQR